MKKKGRVPKPKAPSKAKPKSTRTRSKPITKKLVQSTEDQPYSGVVPDVEVKPEEDEGPFDDEGFSVRERLFIDAMAGPALGNGVRSAQMAGYSTENYHAAGSYGMPIAKKS